MKQYVQARTAIGLLLAAGAAFLALHEWRSWSKPPSSKPVIVSTGQVKRSNQDIYVESIGTIIPEFAITLKTQISGRLNHIYFRDGQTVKKGELLAEIDQAPYEAALKQSEGQLTRDKALLENAKLDMQRYENLWKQDSISKQTLDTQVALVKQYEGTVLLDEAGVENAKINLGYCKITSPINGRIGIRTVDPGNLIEVSTNTTLATINALHPIQVAFSIPQEQAGPLIKEFRGNRTKKPKDCNVSKMCDVAAYDSEFEKILARAYLIAVDNQIDPTTGTLKLKAEFPKGDHLLPNQFVNIRLVTGQLKNALVVPSAAVQYGQEGSYVYRVKGGQKKGSKENKPREVEYVLIKKGFESRTETVVVSGLSEGDVIVVDGVEKLKDGAAVQLSSKK